MQPLILITVGYITGLIWGLYLKINIVPIIFMLFLVSILLIKKLKFINKYKLYIFITILASVISNLQIQNLEKKFDNLYSGLNKVDVVRNNYKRC